MNPKKASKTITERRAGADNIVKYCLAAVTVLIAVALGFLTCWIALGSLDAIEKLALSAPLLIALGMVIGLFAIVSGLMLLWFQITAETAFKFKFTLVELEIGTKGIGIIAMALGTTLSITSLDVLTKIVFQDIPAMKIIPSDPEIDSSKVIEGEEPDLSATKNPTYVLDEDSSKEKPK